MTRKDLKQKILNKLTKAGVDSPAFDTSELLLFALGINAQELISEPFVPVSECEAKKALELTRLRASNVPLQYLLGKWEFMGIPLFVDSRVLIPREDTEVVVRATFSFLEKNPQARIIDLCAGSGAIALSIKKKFPLSSVVAVEKSVDAFAVLEKNILSTGLDVSAENEDIFTCPHKYKNENFDLIISNPPYIKTSEIASLQKEVQKEPSMALDGGLDGYAFYREIVGRWSQKLKKGGMLALELGEGQFEFVAELMHSNGFSDIKSHLDFGEIKRAVTGIFTSAQRR